MTPGDLFLVGEGLGEAASFLPYVCKDRVCLQRQNKILHPSLHSGPPTSTVVCRILFDESCLTG